jgi:hypothetical protein
MESTVNTNRIIPPCMDSVLDLMNVANCEVFYTTTPDVRGKYLAIGYKGKGKHQDWYYNFTTEIKMANYINKYMNECEASIKCKKLRKEKQTMANSTVADMVKVGDIFHYQWGYDQTNCEYFQVVSVKCKTATLRNIGSKSVPGSGGFMSERVSPVKDAFITGRMAETITKRIKAGYNGLPCFTMSFGTLSLTSESETHYSSWYA